MTGQAIKIKYEIMDPISDQWANVYLNNTRHTMVAKISKFVITWICRNVLLACARAKVRYRVCKKLQKVHTIKGIKLYLLLIFSRLDLKEFGLFTREWLKYFAVIFIIWVCVIYPPLAHHFNSICLLLSQCNLILIKCLVLSYLCRFQLLFLGLKHQEAIIIIEILGNWGCEL